MTGQALQHLAVGLVRDAARIPARDLSVSLSDDGGLLKASVTVPVALGARSGKSFIERGAAMREAVVHGMDVFADRHVASVDIRFSGVREPQERRVS